MTIITNRVKLIFNINQLKKDFIFLCFERGNNGKWWGAKELDYLLGNDYKAFAVCYTDKYAYCMFDRNQNNSYQLIEKLRNDDNFNTVSAREVEPKEINKENQENVIFGEPLGRLLLNSLGSSRSKFSDHNFSNLTGNLLKVPQLKTAKLDDSLQVGEVNLNYINDTNNEFLLNVNIATYRLKINILSEYKIATAKRKKQIEKYLKRPQYVIYEGKNILRRWLKSDDNDPKKTYIKAGKNNKKAHQDFLEFSNKEDFDRSRAGIIYQVIEDCQKYLSKYLTLEFMPVPLDQFLEFDTKNLILKEPKKLHSILENQAINIIDLVDNEDSQKLVNDLEKGLKPYFKDTSLISINNKEIKGIFNLRIIHEEKYYQKNNIQDQYLPSDKITPRQNLTIESIKKAESAIIKTLIKELIIKQDITKNKISLFDWNQMIQSTQVTCNKLNTQLSIFDLNKELESQKKWIFAMYNKGNNEDTKDNPILTFMTINSDGSFEFETLNPSDSFFEPHKYDKYHDYIEEAINKENKTKSSFQFEGFILSDNEDINFINLIFRSDEITLPKLQEIESLLKEVEQELPENLNNGLIFIKIVNEFLQEKHNLDVTKFDSLCEKLKQNYQDQLSKTDLYKLIKECLGSERKSKGKISYTANTTEAIKFRDYLLEKYQIRFKFPQDNDSKNYLFDNSLNIKYFAETETEAYYFVGDRKEKIQQSFKDACHIRKIIAVKGSKLIFKDILKTMDVDFVRTGQSTVIPFPFKYIREYQNLTHSN